jgi:hypothetical protein
LPSSIKKGVSKTPLTGRYFCYNLIYYAGFDNTNDAIASKKNKRMEKMDLPMANRYDFTYQIQNLPMAN